MRTPKLFSYPLDRAAAIAILVLVITVTGVVLFAQQPAPAVREFSWQEKPVGAEDQAFLSDL